MKSFRPAARAALVCTSLFALAACGTANFKKGGKSSGSAPAPAPAPETIAAPESETSAASDQLQDCPKLRLLGGGHDHGGHGGSWGFGKLGNGGHGGHGGKEIPFKHGGWGKEPNGPDKQPYEPGKEGGWGKEPYGPDKQPYEPGKEPYVPGHDDGDHSYEPGKGEGEEIVIVPTEPKNPCGGEGDEPGKGEEPTPDAPPAQELGGNPGDGPGQKPGYEPGKEPCGNCENPGYEPNHPKQQPHQGPSCGKDGKLCEQGGPGQY